MHFTELLGGSSNDEDQFVDVIDYLYNCNYSTGGEVAIRNDKTLWAWGYNDKGALGQNNRTTY